MDPARYTRSAAAWYSCLSWRCRGRAAWRSPPGISESFFTIVDVVGLQVAVDDLFGVGGSQCGVSCLISRSASITGIRPAAFIRALVRVCPLSSSMTMKCAVRELTKRRDRSSLMINDVDGGPR